jgi:hypothetical protein
VGDLEELAGLCNSRRRVLIVVALVIVCVALAIAVVAAVDVALGIHSSLTTSLPVVGGAIVALTLAERFPTRPDEVPAIAVLRDRPAEVAYVVTVRRGADYIALASADGALFPTPMVLCQPLSVYLKPAEREGRRRRALDLVTARCPHARHASVTYKSGPSSVPALVAQAIRELPPA